MSTHMTQKKIKVFKKCLLCLLTFSHPYIKMA